MTVSKRHAFLKYKLVIKIWAQEWPSTSQSNSCIDMQNHTLAKKIRAGDLFSPTTPW